MINLAILSQYQYQSVIDWHLVTVLHTANDDNRCEVPRKLQQQEALINYIAATKESKVTFYLNLCVIRTTEQQISIE